MILLCFDHISLYQLTLSGQEHKMKPDSLEKYSFVYRIYLITGSAQQFQILFNQH